MKKQTEPRVRVLRKTLESGGDVRAALVELVDILFPQPPCRKQAVTYLKGLIKEGRREVLASEVRHTYPDIHDRAWTEAREEVGVSVQKTKAGWLWHLPASRRGKDNLEVG